MEAQQFASQIFIHHNRSLLLINSIYFIIVSIIKGKFSFNVKEIINSFISSLRILNSSHCIILCSYFANSYQYYMALNLVTIITKLNYYDSIYNNINKIVNLFLVLYIGYNIILSMEEYYIKIYFVIIIDFLMTFHYLIE